jgi:16S rRNA (guanine527-N7)-methyltransferase
MKNQLIELLNNCSIELGKGVFPELIGEQLNLYLKEWKKWNSKINLTAECDELSLINKHIFESLQYARAILNVGSLIDIGSGAGFPGIPIKVVRPKLEVVLVESQRKRANFLKTVINTIGLSEIKCIHGRLEDSSQSLGKYNYVTLRHVLEPNLSLRLGANLVKPDGSLILQTSCENSFEPDFLNSLCLLLSDEIIFKRSGRSYSKILVFKRKTR